MSKVLKSFYVMMYILFLMAFIFLGFELFMINVIPNKYLFIIVGIMVLFILLISLGFKFIKRKSFKIFLVLLEFILSIISVISSLYIYRTNKISY